MKSPNLIRRLRILLLLAVFVSIAALYGLFRFGQAGMAPAPIVEPKEKLGDSGRGEVRVASAAFRHVLTDQGKTIFILDGESYQTDPDQQIFIRGMSMQLFLNDQTYTLTSNEAYYNPLNDDVTLLDEVTVSTPSGLRLTTQSLELRQRGRLLRGDEKLEFVYRELAEGEASHLRILLKERLYLLSGDVWMQNLPSASRRFTLSSERLLFDRVRHHIRADGGAKLQVESARLEGQRLSLFLDDTESFPKFIRALWGIAGWVKIGTTEAPRQIDYSGRSLSVNFETASTSPRQFELEGSKIKQARILAKPQARPVQSGFDLSARYLVGHFENGAVAGAEGWSDVVLVETRNGKAGETDPTRGREIRGRRAEALFTPTGDIERAVFDEQVTFLDDEVEVEADRATFHFADLTGEFEGKPVHLRSDRGELSGPVVRYNRATGLLHASGGTRSRLDEAGGSQLLEGSPLGGGEGPIWIEAKEAYLRQEPRGFLFRGQVRAWRGNDLILADSLTGKEEEQSLVAEGHVRTVGHGTGQNSAGHESGDQDGVAEEAAGEPIEVTADAMHYLHAAGSLTYSGSVRSVQGSRTISCQELKVEMNPEGGARSMVCEEKVEILDPLSGTVISGGDRAHYQIGEQVIDIRGNPVRLKDRQGRVVTGKRMVYDLETGTFQSGGSLVQPEAVSDSQDSDSQDSDSQDSDTVDDDSLDDNPLDSTEAAPLSEAENG